VTKLACATCGAKIREHKLVVHSADRHANGTYCSAQCFAAAWGFVEPAQPTQSWNRDIETTIRDEPIASR
jgi:hypothetical protein